MYICLSISELKFLCLFSWLLNIINSVEDISAFFNIILLSELKCQKQLWVRNVVHYVSTFIIKIHVPVYVNKALSYQEDTNLLQVIESM